MSSSGTDHTIVVFHTSVYEKKSRRNYSYFLCQVWNLYNLKTGPYMHHTRFANLLRQVFSWYKGSKTSD
jgi:hypothetical protein